MIEITKKLHINILAIKKADLDNRDGKIAI